MGLLLSVLITCVGVLEVIACYTHFRFGITYNQYKNDLREVARNYALELRRHHLHHLFPDGQPEIEYAKRIKACRTKLSDVADSCRVQDLDAPSCSYVRDTQLFDQPSTSKIDTQLLNDKIENITDENKTILTETDKKTVDTVISNGFHGRDLLNDTVSSKETLEKHFIDDGEVKISETGIGKHEENLEQTQTNDVEKKEIEQLVDIIQHEEVNIDAVHDAIRKNSEMFTTQLLDKQVGVIPSVDENIPLKTYDEIVDDIKKLPESDVNGLNEHAHKHILQKQNEVDAKILPNLDSIEEQIVNEPVITQTLTLDIKVEKEDDSRDFMSDLEKALEEMCSGKSENEVIDKVPDKEYEVLKEEVIENIQAAELEENNIPKEPVEEVFEKVEKEKKGIKEKPHIEEIFMPYEGMEPVQEECFKKFYAPLEKTEVQEEPCAKKSFAPLEEQIEGHPKEGIIYEDIYPGIYMQGYPHMEEIYHIEGFPPGHPEMEGYSPLEGYPHMEGFPHMEGYPHIPPGYPHDVPPGLEDMIIIIDERHPGAYDPAFEEHELREQQEIIDMINRGDIVDFPADEEQLRRHQEILDMIHRGDIPAENEEEIRRHQDILNLIHQQEMPITEEQLRRHQEMLHIIHGNEIPEEAEQSDEIWRQQNEESCPEIDQTRHRVLESLLTSESVDIPIGKYQNFSEILDYITVHDGKRSFESPKQNLPNERETNLESQIVEERPEDVEEIIEISEKLEKADSEEDLPALIETEAESILNESQEKPEIYEQLEESEVVEAIHLPTSEQLVEKIHILNNVPQLYSEIVKDQEKIETLDESKVVESIHLPSPDKIVEKIDVLNKVPQLYSEVVKKQKKTEEIPKLEIAKDAEHAPEVNIPQIPSLEKVSDSISKTEKLSDKITEPPLQEICKEQVIDRLLPNSLQIIEKIHILNNVPEVPVKRITSSEPDTGEKIHTDICIEKPEIEFDSLIHSRRRESIERTILSPLPENSITETTTPTIIPECLKEEPNPDLECAELTATLSPDSQETPRVPSPYPMSLFGIATDNGISDLVVNEDFLRSLDGVKPNRCDDRRRSFKKKRNSSSSSRGSRERSSDIETEVVMPSVVVEKSEENKPEDTKETRASRIDFHKKEEKSLEILEEAKSSNGSEENSVIADIVPDEIKETEPKSPVKEIKQVVEETKIVEENKDAEEKKEGTKKRRKRIKKGKSKSQESSEEKSFDKDEDTVETKTDQQDEGRQRSQTFGAEGTLRQDWNRRSMKKKSRSLETLTDKPDLGQKSPSHETLQEEILSQGDIKRMASQPSQEVKQLPNEEPEASSQIPSQSLQEEACSQNISGTSDQLTEDTMSGSTPGDINRNRRSLKKAKVNSFEEATKSQSEEKNRQLNYNESNMPSSEAFWVKK